jgi:hypothetical protein
MGSCVERVELQVQLGPVCTNHIRASVRLHHPHTSGTQLPRFPSPTNKRHLTKSQLFINYKLKSVAALPWRAMTCSPLSALLNVCCSPLQPAVTSSSTPSLTTFLLLLSRCQRCAPPRLFLSSPPSLDHRPVSPAHPATASACSVTTSFSSSTCTRDGCTGASLSPPSVCSLSRTSSSVTNSAVVVAGSTPTAPSEASHPHPHHKLLQGPMQCLSCRVPVDTPLTLRPKRKQCGADDEE